MENLLLREVAAQRRLLFAIILALAALGIALHELHKSLQARKHPPKRRRKQKQASSVRTSVLLVAIISVMGAYMVGYQCVKLHDFHLDRTEGTVVAAQGVITRAGRVSKGKSGYYYRILLDVGYGEKLNLRIHKSLYGDYAFEEGAEYEVTYYPHSMSLSEAEKVE